MKIYTKFLVLCFVLLAVFASALSVHAMVPTLSVSPVVSNSVLLSVYGDSNANVTLNYTTSYGNQSVYLGNTNNSGYFSSTINTNTYNILQNGNVYVTINNQQSPAVMWPSYNYGSTYNSTNTFGFNISNLTLSVGNSITLTSSNGSNIYVFSNSNPNVAGNSNFVNSIGNTFGCFNNAQFNTSTGQPCYNQNYNQNYYQNQNTNSSSVTINALAYGTTTMSICQGNQYNNQYNYGNTGNSCNTIYLTVNSAINTAYNSNYLSNQGYVTNTGNVLGASTCGFYRTLRLGMSGADVSCLQSLLAAKGYLINGNNYSSYFDQQTKNAVMTFQQDRGLYPDGVFGANTRMNLGY